MATDHFDPGVDQLVTGEAVALELPPASVGVRLVSGLIDVVLQVLVLVAGSFVAAWLSPDEALGAVTGIVLVAVTFVLGPALLETLTLGRTVGKLALGVRTVRDDGGPISFHHAFMRHLVAVVEVWTFLGVPALVSALVSGKGKRLGDHVAGTYVVRDRFRLRLPWPAQMPPHLAAWAHGADIAPLPDSLAMAVRQLLGRTATLSPQARDQLLHQLCQQVAHHVSPPPPMGTHPTDFLAAVSAERRRRDEWRLWRERDLRDRLTHREGNAG